MNVPLCDGTYTAKDELVMIWDRTIASADCQVYTVTARDCYYVGFMEIIDNVT